MLLESSFSMLDQQPSGSLATIFRHLEDLTWSLAAMFTEFDHETLFDGLNSVVLMSSECLRVQTGVHEYHLELWTKLSRQSRHRNTIP